jgi:hypothetical protein
MVTVSDLAEILPGWIRSDSYSLNQDRTETYCLIHERGTWIVYYSERGQRSNAQDFVDENDACRAFIERLLLDHHLLAGARADLLKAYYHAHFPG